MAKDDYTMEERQEILKDLMLRLHAGEDKEVIHLTIFFDLFFLTLA